MIVDFFKRNSIILMFSVFCLVLLVLILYQMDRQYYQTAKKDIITNMTFTYTRPLSDKEETALLSLAQDELHSDTPNQERIRKEVERILNGDNVIWRIVIKKARQESGANSIEEQDLIDIARLDKLRRYNRFSNSLFLHDFSGIVIHPINDVENHPTLGRLMLFYTSPLGNPQIEELTTLYRWYCVFIIAAMGLLAYAVARRLLVPIRNVTSAIDGSTAARTTFVGRPHSRLESLYNRMALDAVIARLQGQMRDEIARQPQTTGWEVVEYISNAFNEQLGPAFLTCIEMVAEGPGQIRATGQNLFFNQHSLNMTQEELLGQVDQLMPRDGRTEERFALPDAEPPIEGAMELLPDPERSGIRYLFALGLDPRLHDNATLATRHMLNGLTDLVDMGLQALSLRNQILVQERGRANISLSRNLGHDLTNIIATGKLELMALERLLGGGQPPQDERRRTILVESLHGLLRSVRFMQETVNLYRAYAFLQHPILETHDGNKLVNATMDLFAMSISAKVDLRRELAPDAPRCVVDPRLIKLALFNLFANALEAIRKANPDRSADGWIKVATQCAAGGGLSIAVEDSGTGIINAEGQLAESHEIEKIFELGYTSRRVSGAQGEGLGLNWVRTIVQDLHGGTIVAENAPGGGARFVLSFPPLGAVIATGSDGKTEE